MESLTKWIGFIFFLTTTKTVYTKTVEIKCPEFCVCDSYQNLRRVVCQNRSLVSIELNIPSQAQILDLSNNHISELGDKIFLGIGLRDLKLLNLSHNKIRQIHFNGFEGLEKLKTLDLSFNAIQYFTKSWFVSLNSLQELYLRGNKLRSINEEPLINIGTLKVLDISKCGITYLDNDIFSLTPNLEQLDISENYLQRITANMLKPMIKLRVLKAHDNNFNCKDRALINAKTYIKTSDISYKDPCSNEKLTSFTVNSNVQKFQKMIMASDVKVTTVQPKNLWIFDDEDVNNTKIIEVCTNNTNKTLNEYDINENSLLNKLLKWSPWAVISVTFIYGVLLGTFLGSFFNFCFRHSQLTHTRNTNIEESSNSDFFGTYSAQSLSSIVSRRDKRNATGCKRSNSILYTTLQKARRQMSRESFSNDEIDNTLVMNEFDIANSTPVQIRKCYS